MRYPWIRTKGLVSPNGATRPKPRVRERWRRDGTLGFGTSIFKEPYRGTLKAGQRVIGTVLLAHYEGFEGPPVGLSPFCHA